MSVKILPGEGEILEHSPSTIFSLHLKKLIQYKLKNHFKTTKYSGNFNLRPYNISDDVSMSVYSSQIYCKSNNLISSNLTSIDRPIYHRALLQSQSKLTITH